MRLQSWIIGLAGVAAIGLVCTCLLTAADQPAAQPDKAGSPVAGSVGVGLKETTPAGDATQHRNKIVRVVTVTQERIVPGKDMPPDKIVEATMDRLNKAAVYKPDIACLPELWNHGEAEAVPGPTTEMMSKWAIEHNCYVISPIATMVGGKKYNSAVLIDRKGHVVGQYNKIHPVEGEIEEGTTPGDLDPPVFNTDFGVIGMQICFDVNWRDSWSKLKEKGAKIIFWPSAYPAATQLAALAWQNKVFVVTSTDAEVSRIYDISGEVLASTGLYQQWAAAELPLGKRLFEIDFNVKRARAAQQKYGGKISVTWKHEDDWLTIASLDPDLTVEDLIAEFGLTPLEAYQARCKQVQDQARGKTLDQLKEEAKKPAPTPAPASAPTSN